MLRKPVVSRRTDREPRPRSRPGGPEWSTAWREGAATALPVPGAPPPRLFGDVLTARRSERDLAAPSLADVAGVLWHAARTRASDVRGPGRQWQSRAAPSAGGLHPIHVVVCRLGRAGGVRRYDPLRHAFVSVRLDAQAVASFVREVDAVVPNRGAILTLVADLRTTSRWYAHARSLVWRDAGCQLAVLHLVASWLGLGSCLLGLEGHQLTKAMGSDGIVPAGVMLLGRLPSSLC